MIQEIKNLRVQIDGLAQLVNQLKPDLNGCADSHETLMCYDSLILSKAWLGKVLGELGNENPYGSGYKTKEDIVPTQDVNDEVLHPYNPSTLHFLEKNHIEKVDWLRQEIEKLSNTIMDLKSNTHTISYIASIATTSCFNYLCEARFWLGFELEKIKNEQ